LKAPVIYVAHFLDDPDAIYAEMVKLPWTRRPGFMGHLVPRDEVWIAPYDYRYSRRLYPAYDGWTPELLAIKAKVEKLTGVKYDSVLCNFYRTGKDSVAFHCDCEDEMSSDHPIASVTLGAERVFQMRSKDGKHNEKVTLANGSALVMGAGMQEKWEHAVPKTAKDIGGRINLTFRVMTPGDANVAE